MMSCVLLAIASLLTGSSAHAEAITEYVHITATQISDSTLKQAVGVLTLTGRTRADTSIALYEKFQGRFRRVPDLDLDLYPPVSLCGNADEFGGRVVGYRYIVTAVQSGWAEIVYDPAGDRRGWLKRSDVTDDFYAEWLLLDDRWDVQNDYVDILWLSPDGTREIYDGPSARSRKKLVSREDVGLGTGRLRVLDARSGYLQVGQVADPSGQGNVGVEKADILPLGWVPLRDRKGRLSVWFYCFDVD